MPLVVITFLCLGTGNGAVFQLVPGRFGESVGMATGVVGAAGGVGGFLVPNLLGGVEGLTGSFAAGFVALAAFALYGLVWLRLLGSTREGWRASPGAATAPARVAMIPYLA